MGPEFLATEYRDMHARGVFSGRTVLKYVDSLMSLFTAHGVHTFLDYGCGPGTAWDMFTPAGTTASLYDPYHPKHDVLPAGPFDAVIAIDVLEHVPEDSLPRLFRDVFDRATRLAAFSFCNRPARKTFSNGENVHVTQKPAWWWSDQMLKFNKRKIAVVIWETP